MPVLTEPSLKQRAVVPLVAAGMLSMREIARTLQIDPATVKQALANPVIKAEIARARAADKRNQLDNARALAKKALGKAHAAVDEDAGDPIGNVQLAAGAITVAAKHSESFGDENEQQISSEDKQEYRKHLLRQRLIGAKAALRCGAAVLESYRAKLR